MARSVGDAFFGRIVNALILAFFGALAWIFVVIMARWVLLFAFVFFGIDWAPAFFGGGMMLFAAIGAIIGLLDS